MDVRRKFVLPVDSLLFEEYVCNWVEIVVAGDFAVSCASNLGPDFGMVEHFALKA